MRYAVSPVPNAAEIDRAAASSLRFGDVLFQRIEGDAPGADEDAATGGIGRSRAIAREAAPERLHLVVQKGRLFQREHPGVPVLLDKGRYLVVDLGAEEARAWDCGDRPCFSIRPLASSGVVFDQRPPRADRGAATPWLQALVDGLERAAYEADLKHLVDATTRLSTSPQYTAVATSTRASLIAMGYQTRVQAIRVGGAGSSNVIADKPGQGPSPRKVVVVSAHLDSINIEGGSAAPAPGADDDGSGSAGVLAIARALKAHDAVHDLRLIFFGGEEQGLLGSRHYVASLPAAERRRILGVVNMDMIATRNVATPSVLLEGSTLSQGMIDGLASAATAFTSLQVQTSLHPFNSDHVSFLDASIPAVLTIEGTDDANDNIHSARDTLNHIDFDLAMDILRMNLAFVATSLGKTP